MSYGAKIICDSLAPSGSRLTTFEVTFPRIVLAEFNTHRMFSRNSASSRAIPVKTMVDRVWADPFEPVYWGKNQKGMQAELELTNEEIERARQHWLVARDHSVKSVENLIEVGVHKQITNRLLEPWLWHTAIVTATEWSNFFNLRTDKNAQPEIQKAASLMLEIYRAGTPEALNSGDAHLPLVTGYDRHDLEVAGVSLLDMMKISAGRCARVSYLTHEGKRDHAADVDLADSLLKNGHMSPFEHPAVALTEEEWFRYALEMNNRWILHRVPVGNFWGWKSYRKEILMEHDRLANMSASRVGG